MTSTICSVFHADTGPRQWLKTRCYESTPSLVLACATESRNKLMHWNGFVENRISTGVLYLWCPQYLCCWRNSLEFEALPLPSGLVNVPSCGSCKRSPLDVANIWKWYPQKIGWCWMGRWGWTTDWLEPREVSCHLATALGNLLMIHEESFFQHITYHRVACTWWVEWERAAIAW